MEVSGLGGLTSVPHFIVSPAFKIDYLNGISCRSWCVMPLRAYICILFIKKPAYVLGWVFLQPNIKHCHLYKSVTLIVLLDQKKKKTEKTSQLCLIHLHFTAEF